MCTQHGGEGEDGTDWEIIGKKGGFLLYTLLYIWILNHVDVILVFKNKTLKRAFNISSLGQYYSRELKITQKSTNRGLVK